MFPEGTRRNKGLRKKHQPRPHTGTVRIAMAANAPLVPAAIDGMDRLSRLRPLRISFGAPIALGRSPRARFLRDSPRGNHPALGGDPAARGGAHGAVRPLMAIDGDSLRPPCLPRAPELDQGRGGTPGRRDRRLRQHARDPLGYRAASHGRGRLGHADDADLPARGVPPLPGRPRVRRRELTEQLDLLPGAGRRSRLRLGEGAGFEADDFLARRARAERTRRNDARRHERPRRLPACERARDARHASSRRFEIARVGPEEVRERYGVDPQQVPDFIALRGDPSDRLPGAPGCRAKMAASILRSTGRWRPRSTRAASARSRRICASTGESPRSRLRPSPRP